MEAYGLIILLLKFNKLDSNGNFIANYSTAGNNIGYGISPDTIGNVWIAGGPSGLWQFNQSNGSITGSYLTSVYGYGDMTGFAHEYFTMGMRFNCSPYSYNFSNLSEGIYYYNVTVSDTSGNLNFSGTRNVTVDTIIPAIGYINSTSSGVLASGSSISINVTSTDTNFGNITIFSSIPQGLSIRQILQHHL